MKRYETWLAAVLGVTAGLLGGFFLGQSFSTPANPSEHPTVEKAGVEAVPAGAAAEPNAREWLAHYAGQFGKSAEGATPGLADAIKDALQVDGVFGEGRMLMLIEMMKKEDFPVALEILRKAKVGLNGGAQGANGSPMWMAFWQRFGEVDGATALTSALGCKDLQYTGRDTLEKWLFRGMTMANPEGAAQAFLDHPEMQHRPQALESLVLLWARKDTKAAMDWVQANLTDPQLVTSAYTGAAWGKSTQQDIAGGTAFLKDLPESAPRMPVIEAIKYQIGVKPYVPAAQLLDFIATTRSLGQRDAGFEAHIAGRIGASDPFAAAEFFAQPLVNGPPNDYASLRIVTAQWERRDPVAAEAWEKGQAGTPYFGVVAKEFALAAHERNDAEAEQRWTEEAAK